MNNVHVILKHDISCNLLRL